MEPVLFGNRCRPDKSHNNRDSASQSKSISARSGLRARPHRGRGTFLCEYLGRCPLPSATTPQSPVSMATNGHITRMQVYVQEMLFSFVVRLPPPVWHRGEAQEGRGTYEPFQMELADPKSPTSTTLPRRCATNSGLLYSRNAKSIDEWTRTSLGCPQTAVDRGDDCNFTTTLPMILSLTRFTWKSFKLTAKRLDSHFSSAATKEGPSKTLQ